MSFNHRPFALIISVAAIAAAACLAWYAWCVCALAFRVWSPSGRYDMSLQKAAEKAGFVCADHGNGWRLGVAFHDAPDAEVALLNYSYRRRITLWPFGVRNHIDVRSAPICTTESDGDALTAWALARNKELTDGVWTIYRHEEHNGQKKGVPAMFFMRKARLDRPPEKLAAAIRAVAEESATASGFFIRLPPMFSKENAERILAAAVARKKANMAERAGLPPGEAFQDKELLPVGIDDDHLACWTWPAKLEETMSGRPPTFEKFEERDWPGFRPKYGGETAISFHRIWSGRRMYDAVDPASEEARKALADWDAASEPPLLYYHIDRRTGDASWTPIDFALSRDGRWMLCQELDDSSFHPATGTWNGWLLLSIPEWRQTRILRLFFELPEKQEELAAIREWPSSARYSPFADGLSDAEHVDATGRDTDAPREVLRPPELDSPRRFWGVDDGLTATNAKPVRSILDSALKRLGPPSVRRTFASERNWIHSWAWTKGEDALVVRIERGESPQNGPLCAKVFAGPLADLGELGEEAVGRAVQDGWGRFGGMGCRRSGESSNLVDTIVYHFSDAPTPIRRDVEIRMDCGSPLDSGSATYTVTDERGATVLRFQTPLNFYVVKQALYNNRFRLFPKRVDWRVGGSIETIELLAESGEMLAFGRPETDCVKWVEYAPFMKKVEDVMEHVLPFAVHEVRQMTMPRQD